jgi:hypothetical protein
MRGLKMKKKLIIFICCFVCVAAVILGILLQPAKLESLTIEFKSVSDVELEENKTYYDDEIAAEPDSSKLLSYNENPFPSKDPKDYVEGYISVDMKNRGIFDAVISGAVMNFSLDRSSIIFAYSKAFSEVVPAYGEENICVIYFFAYAPDDIAKQNLETYLKSLETEIMVGRFILGHYTHYSVSACFADAKVKFTEE